MKVALLDENLLTAATLTSSATSFAYGHPGAYLVDPDPLKRALWRGTFWVQAGVNDDLDFTEGVARAGTVAAGVYESPAEYWAAVAAGMNAAGGSTDYRAYMRPGSSARYRGEIANPTQAHTLDLETGPSAATSSLVLLGGFRAEDRASGNTHTGDYASRQGPTTGDPAAFDLGSASRADGLFLAGLEASPAAIVEVRAGTTTGVSDFSAQVAGYADPEVLGLLFSTAISYRYLQVRVYDPRGEEVPQTGLGVAYYGPVWTSDDEAAFDRGQEFEAASLARSMEQRSMVAGGVGGHAFVSEVRPGDRFAVAFGQGPGLGSAAPELEGLVESLGRNEYAFVMTDVARPHRESALCRLSAPPTFFRNDVESRHGRWSVGLQFEAIGAT